ncbi:hypothetical protein CTI12_AA376220 [Artemisia annua]|uniref:C2 NT-type domain-containing protein n=1 Tax=Artemisia annua TaxID=35608 RepID=A0A2U1MIQ0_ARTAN|nr:hypothetical protein CTI12_AA376220 [Artemisia annua]
MVLGLKTRNRNSPYVHLDYVINLVEIKPWPPSQSLRSVRSALIQWEHGDKFSGSTKAVAPSNAFGLGVGDGKIEFNESFKLPVTLSRDMSVKTSNNETFLRNCIEFNLYEPRRDKTVKGQLLATAVIDFAEYGIFDDSFVISVPMNCKRMFGNTAQPMLFVEIQMVEKNNRVRCSFGERLIREGSMDKNVCALMNAEYAEEADTASVTDNNEDDDVSSRSSMDTGSSASGSNGNVTPQSENGSEAICGSSEKVNSQEVSVQSKRAIYEERISSSKDLYSELENARTTLSNLRNSRFTMLPQNTESCSSAKLSKPIGKNDTRKVMVYEANNESHIIGDIGTDSDSKRNAKRLDSSVDSGISNGSVRTSKVLEKFKNVGICDKNYEKNLTVNEISDASKVQHLEQRMQLLEGELRESAAIEISLYSVVAEHGRSINKVHAPARRLSRLYLHACKDNSFRRASSAKSIVSGLILVAKACGNDVPRLTFWLSNSVVLRAIIHKNFDKEKVSGIVKKGGTENSNEREDPCMVISLLEKVESWIFMRIIESIWWQTLAPYMQSTAAKEIPRVVDSGYNKTCQTTSGSLEHEQVHTSVKLWKTAFMDACERICPVRAAGHDCGCLSVLSMLIMEQCMARLDVAMFNAILRQSEDEGPTDPVSDPISDVGVLPIPSGKASFGAGAQLKTTIGNWSSWLTDLFGSPISFHLLTALSELMMLPKDMVLSNTVRKEVCPTIGVALIKRILDRFVPDEFCPDVIPKVVLESLNSKDLTENGEDCITSLPCRAAPILYQPPSASLIGCILGNDGSRAHLSRSGSSILKKSNTSDDELDELDSPLTLIIDSCQPVAASTKPVWALKDVGNGNTSIRYQLLREIWMSSD